MAVKIRLTRMGAKNAPAYRVVVTDSRSPREGRYLENLGWYDPKKVNEKFALKLDRIDDWLGRGAELSDTVSSLVRTARKQQAAAEPVAAEAAEPVAG